MLHKTGQEKCFLFLHQTLTNKCDLGVGWARISTPDKVKKDRRRVNEMWSGMGTAITAIETIDRSKFWVVQCEGIAALTVCSSHQFRCFSQASAKYVEVTWLQYLVYYVKRHYFYGSSYLLLLLPLQIRGNIQLSCGCSCSVYFLSTIRFYCWFFFGESVCFVGFWAGLKPFLIRFQAEPSVVLFSIRFLPGCCRLSWSWTNNSISIWCLCIW